MYKFWVNLNKIGPALLNELMESKTSTTPTFEHETEIFLGLMGVPNVYYC